MAESAAMSTKAEIKERLMSLAPPEPHFTIVGSLRTGFGLAIEQFAERLAESATIMHARVTPGLASVWGRHDSDATHSAVFLDVQPIDQAVSVEEIVENLRKVSTTHELPLLALAARIERFGIRGAK